MTATRARPQQERSRETREHLLEVAARLLAERGVEGISTNHIAAEARMSIGTLYRYFGNKQELIADLRLRTLGQLEEQFTSAVLGSLSLSPEAGVRAGLVAITEALTERRDLVRALLATDFAPSSSLVQPLEKRLLLLTRAYLLHATGPRSDAELNRRAWLMVTVGLATSMRIALDAPADLDREELVDETARMLGGWLAG